MLRRASVAPGLAFVLAAGLVGIAGCGDTSGPRAADGQGLAAGQPAPADTAAAVAGGQAPVTAPDGPVLASRTATLGGQPIRAQLVLLRRTGSLAQLVVRLTNTGKGDALIQGGLGSGPADHTVSGISLIDSVNRKRHVVVRDSTGGCLCSRTEISLAPGQSAHLSATFAAPPPDVRKVVVDVPTYGAFVDIALEG